MPLEVFQPAQFQFPHERETFAFLEHKLRERIGCSPKPHLLIGNFHVGGRELDALFVATGLVVLIEMKHYAGRVRFSENGPWTVNEEAMRESADGNPFRQARNYRFLLRDFLRRKSKAFGGHPGREWGHIRAMVLFGRPISLANAVPSDISLWFQIADVTNVVDRLLVDPDSEILPTVGDVEQLKLDLDIQCPNAELRSGAPAQIAFKIILIKQGDFRASLRSMLSMGLEFAQGVREIEDRLDEARKFPLRNPFNDWPFRVGHEIGSSIIYAVNEEVELVCLFEGRSKIFPLFAGPKTTVAEWLARNAGTVLTISGNDYRLSLTVATASEITAPPLPSAKTSLVVEPYLKALAGPDLEAVLPAGILRRNLESIDETASDEDIELVLASLNEDSASLFRDLFRLLRSGDVIAAKSRLDLRTGATTLAGDVPATLDEAVDAAANSDQIAILNELPAEDIKQILRLDRFKEWMYFLHPDQKRYVEAEYDRPVVLTGVSGSGKTCILVHRARYLARKFPGARIGIFTLNRHLAGLLRDLLSDLLTPEERKNVEVFAYYDYFSDLLHELGVEPYLQQLLSVAGPQSPLARAVERVDRARVAREFDARSNETLEDTWDDFVGSLEAEMIDLLRPVRNLLSSQRVDHNRYLREEFTLIRSMWSPESRDSSYPGFDRSEFSRVIPFNQAIRLEIQKLLLRYEEYMLAGGMLDVMSLTHALMPLRGAIAELPADRKFRFVLVDEFQDFSNLDLSILREICTNAKTDSLFLAGDLVQKVLVKKLILREAGFDSTAAKWLRIRRNFRNSRQILAAAAALAKHYGEIAASKKEEIEILDPELAVRETAKPFAIQTNRPIDKAWEIAYRMVVHQKKAPWTVCIASADDGFDSVRRILDRRPSAIEAQQLSEDWVNHRDRVAVCTLSELKGFEFHLVVLVGLERGNFPNSGVPEGERWRDALRLYVGMTRARDELYLLYSNVHSGFLDVMKGLLCWRTEDVMLNLPRANAPLHKSPDKRENTTWTIAHEMGCADWFTPIQLRHLLDYYFVFVDRIPNLRALSPQERRTLEISKDGLFKMWLKPSVLKAVNIENLSRLGRAGVALTEEIIAVCGLHGLKLQKP